MSARQDAQRDLAVAVSHLDETEDAVRLARAQQVTEAAIRRAEQHQATATALVASVRERLAVLRQAVEATA